MDVTRTGGSGTGLESGRCNQNYGGSRTVRSRFNIIEAGSLLPLREDSGDNEREKRAQTTESERSLRESV